MKYRKKPVVIDAWEISKDTPMPEWVVAAFGALNRGIFWDVVGVLHVITLEGVMHAKPGDMLIRGVKGELYPCKPDIFAATYELVKEQA